MSNFSLKDIDVCESHDFRVASVSPQNGIGDFSDVATISPPEPQLTDLRHVSSNFKPATADNKVRFPNGTIEITLTYDSKGM